MKKNQKSLKIKKIQKKNNPKKNDLNEFRLVYVSYLALLFITPSILQLIAGVFNHHLSYTVIFERLHILGFILLGLFFIIYEVQLSKYLTKFKERKLELCIGVFFAIFFAGHYYIWRYLYITSNQNWLYSFVSSSLIYFFFSFFLAIGIFGSTFLKRTLKEYKSKLFALVGFIIFYAYIKKLFEHNWQYFANMVNQIAVAVLGLFYDASASQGNSAPILQVEDFIVSVARDCSGIESSTLFLFLFAIVLLFDNTIKNNFKTYLFVGLGVAGAFLITALRVILLSIVGVEISPELAVTSFHANIGWVLFVLYVFIFYAFLKKYSK